MIMYQSLLIVLVSLPFCVLENLGLKKYTCKCNCSLSTQIFEETEVLLQGSDFIMSETQQLIC